MKRLKIFSLVLVLCFVLTGCYSNLGKKDIFKQYADDFEAIKDVFVAANLDLGENGLETYLLVQNEESVITGLFSCPINLTKEEVRSLNRLQEFLRFDTIILEEDRIRFGGLSHKMVVWSKSGVKPEYFYSPDDDVRFKTEKLSENWFFLLNTVR